MKYAKFGIIVFVLYFLGYVLGPSITPMLVDKQSGKSELVKTVTIRGGATYEINLEHYRTDELPKTIKVKKPVELTTNSGEGVKMITAGSKVKLLNREGLAVTIESMDGIAKGLVNIEDTDLFGALAQMKFEKEAGKVAGGTPTPPTPPVKPTPPVVADNNPKPPVDPPTPPENTGNSGVMATNTGSGDEPDPGPDKPAPTPDIGDKKLTADEIVALMKKFIAAGTLKEFEAEQVKTWKAGEDESIDGVTYQIGLVTYMAQTIFGEKPVNAKALIKGGEIDRWVFAKSGMEMR